VTARPMTQTERQWLTQVAIERGIVSWDVFTLDDLADELFGFQVTDAPSVWMVSALLTEARGNA